MRIRFVFLAAVMVTALLLVGCGSENERTERTDTTNTNTTTEQTTSTTEQTTATDTPVDTQNVKEYDAGADNAKFNVAIETNDLAACNEIENTVARDGCINNVVIAMAKTSTDPKVCDQAKSDEVKTTCLSVLGTKIVKEEPAAQE